MSKVFVPHKYQVRAENHVMDNMVSALFLDMGLGKTVISLNAISKLQDNARTGAALVVAPLRVATLTWPEEAKVWTQTKHLRIQPVVGSLKKRLKALAKPADIYTINYENFVWLMQDWLTEQERNPFDIIIFDESSKMKSAKARRFKVAKAHIKKFKRRVILSGTPAPQSYEDLWSQFYLLDEGKRLGEYVTHFRDRYFRQIDRFGWKRVIKPGAQRTIERKIADLTLCLLAEDYLKMPKLIVNQVPVVIPPKAMVIYKKLEKEMFTKIENAEVEVFNAAALTNKCRQLSAGFGYDDKKVAHFLHKAKTDTLADIIDDAQGTPVLVAYQFKGEAEAFRKRWPKAPIVGSGFKGDLRKTIRAWNAGKIPVMFMHPQSLGHGINLQHGGHTLVWTTLPWSLEAYQQTVKRLHRQGQTKAVIVHHLLARDTVDAAVAAAVRGKAKGQDQLLAVLTAYARRKNGPCKTKRAA